MFTYYAIARRQGEWTYICSGTRPEELYRQAITLIEAQEGLLADELPAHTPGVESQLDTLRVVPEETAKEQYHVIFLRTPPAAD